MEKLEIVNTSKMISVHRKDIDVIKSAEDVLCTDVSSKTNICEDLKDWAPLN